MSGRKNIPPNTNQSYPPEFNHNFTNEVIPLARPVNYRNSQHLPSAYVGDNKPPQALNVTSTSNMSGTGGIQPHLLATNVIPDPEFISNQEEEEVRNVSNGPVPARVVPRIINQQRISNATRLEREAADRRMMENIGNMFAQRREARRRAEERRAENQPINPQTPPGTPPPQNNGNGPPYRPRTPPGSPSNITDITITDRLHNSEPMRRRRSQGPVRTTRPQSGPRQLTRRTPPRGGKGKTKKNKKINKTKKNKKNKNKTKRKTIRRRK